MGEPVVELPFFGGLDEGTRDEYIEPGKAFPVIENARQDHRGGLTKRLGYEELLNILLDGSFRSAGRRLFQSGDQLCVINGTHLDVQSEALDRAVVASRVPEATCRLLGIPAVGTSTEVDDLAQVNGVLVVGYMKPGEGHVMLAVDAVTKVVLHGPVKIDSSITSRTLALATYGNYAVAVYAPLATGNLYAKYLDTSSAASIAAGWQAIGANIATDSISGAEALNAVSVTANDRIAVAYRNTSGATSQTSVLTLRVSGVVETTTINTSGVVPDVIGLAEGGDTLWVAWNETTTAKAIGLAPTSLSTVTATTSPVITSFAGVSQIEVVPRAQTGGTAAVIVQTDSPRIYARNIKIESGAAATDGATTEICNAQIQGRPFSHGGRVYAHFSSALKTELVLCDATPGSKYLRPVAVPIPRGLFAAQEFPFLPCRTRTVPTTGGKYLHGFVVKKSGVTTAPTLVQYDFEDPSRWQPTELNGMTYLSGGVESVFDGTNVFEVNYLAVPAIVGIDLSTIGALTFTKGGRRYVAVYEEIDSKGNRHISGVSPPSAATGNFNSRYPKVQVRPLAMTSRGASLRVSIYGTTDGGEPPYYFVGAVENAPNVSYVEFTDIAADLDLQARELLYGTGLLPGTSVQGQQTGAGQDHRAPPGFVDHTTYNGMIVGAAGTTLWCTASALDGEGAWTSPVFTAQIPEEVTAIESQDTVLYAFSRRSIFSLTGDPPSDNGLVGGLGTPHRLAGDSGCINPNSVVATGSGIFYQSERGIELLGRGGAGGWIGEPVQNTLASYPTVTSAVLDDKHGLVRFSLMGSSGEGRDLVFDLTSQKWQSVDDKHGSVDHQASQDAAMVMVDGAYRYGWLSADGKVYVEHLPGDADAYLDGTTWVKTKVETPWVHIAGVAGEQVIESYVFLAARHTDHDLTVTTHHDYLGSMPDTWTWPAAQITALPKEWLDKGIRSSRGQAVKLVIEDAAPSSGTVGAGKGATWIAVTLVGVPHRGARRTSGAERGA